MKWLWTGFIVLLGFVSTPAWPGWLLILFTAALVFPPIWKRLAAAGVDTREKGRMATAAALTVLLTFGAWSSLQFDKEIAETDRLIDDNKALLASMEEQYPSEDHSFKWEYSAKVDPMTDQSVKLACIRSSNAVRLSPPYEATRARLCLRNDPKLGRDAYVTLEKSGQVMCHAYQDCTVHARFDKLPVKAFTAVAANDGSTEVFFFKNAKALEAGLRGAKVTAIEAEYYQAGNQVMSFDTQGLRWE